MDEAHSSQSGDAARELRLVLSGTGEDELTAAEAEDSGLFASGVDPVEEALARAAGARGRQANLSFFAFTATPKAKTLELFGRKNEVTGLYEPFHLYSMRQAIAEGFILDVLANYTTYQTYWKIEKAVADDPAYESAKARRAIARFVDLHPSNLAQKAEIVVEHFRAKTAKKIAGRAKAMVVTSSRLHAIRYKQAIDAYLERRGYTDLATLVAFSGRVLDDAGIAYTEAGMNHFPESETAAKFDTEDYQVLIVAEKFQTGFDQPLLHTLYVDKVLTGVAAVQTLSRANRTHPDKTDTFVLDFRNDGDDIRAAFEPYVGMTVAPPTDPNLIYDVRVQLDDFDVLRAEEIQAALGILLGEGGRNAHGALHGLLDPAVERFRALSEEDRLAFHDALQRFVRLYAFLSQVLPFVDPRLEGDHAYLRALGARIGSASSGRLDLGSEVELTHLRTQLSFEGSLSPEGVEGEVRTIFGEGRGKTHEAALEPLSAIVATLNERFGLTLTEADQLFFDQIEAECNAKPDLVAQARTNTLENFRLVFDPGFLQTVIERVDDNEALFKRILDDTEFRQVLTDLYASRVYRSARREE